MIDFNNVTRSYAGKVAVDRLTLNVPPGELFALLGPNGAGKTTTIKMLAGLLRPMTGSVRVCGHDLVTDVRQATRSIGLPRRVLVAVRHPEYIGQARYAAVESKDIGVVYVRDQPEVGHGAVHRERHVGEQVQLGGGNGSRVIHLQPGMLQLRHIGHKNARAGLPSKLEQLRPVAENTLREMFVRHEKRGDFVRPVHREHQAVHLDKLSYFGALHVG